MASTSQRPLLLALLILSILAISATARPCKSLFISSYSVSLRRFPSSSSSSGFVTVVTEIRQLKPIRFDDAVLDNPNQNQPDASADEARQPQQRMMPLLPLSTDLTSLRDRTKDILSVVVALLFGVGCGALTAATMYLAWSLFSTRHDDDADDVSPKKVGYVKIPEAVVDSAPVKEAKAAAV
ncbi:uncharacterized protein LOC112192703 [Rosa chinensis]|uniref:uncharacterized protein LOC112192703 n=1 Tax=Rosa chinensis TaxID=74649 RepID=UPI000D08B698|nr:uncharacterized protein LOC112192703 [Rosa chinensis]